ncbi:MAG: NADH-quinone oxidoreductase subunit C [Chloroflexi bacterium]|nr:NADH-quinone oxidoreductase subunit C [Chloroflexota bacterium]
MDATAIERTLGQACSAPVELLPLATCAELFVDIPSASLLAAMEGLMREHDLYHLTTITALRDGDGFLVLYHLWLGGGLTLRVRCSGAPPSLPSVCHLLPVAEWYEREVHDLFGIRFEGHPNLKPLLLPEDWVGPPPMLAEETP